MVLRTGLDGCGKSRLYTAMVRFDPRTVQRLASRYTDWAIVAKKDSCSSDTNIGHVFGWTKPPPVYLTKCTERPCDNL
jgi:hypothetical protein